jgi:hypothetical protein
MHPVLGSGALGRSPLPTPSPTCLGSFAGRLKPLFWCHLRRAGHPAFQVAEPPEFLGRFVLLRHAAILSRAGRHNKGSENTQQVNFRELRTGEVRRILPRR